MASGGSDVPFDTRLVERDGGQSADVVSFAVDTLDETPRPWEGYLLDLDGKNAHQKSYNSKELGYGEQSFRIGSVITNPTQDMLIEFTKPGFKFVETSSYHYDIYVIDPAAFNFETASEGWDPVRLDVKFTNRADGYTAIQWTDFYLTNIVEKVQDLRWQWGGSVAENSETNTTLGTVTAFNPERYSTIKSESTSAGTRLSP